MQFLTSRDAAARLNNNVIMHEGRPVFVRRVDEVSPTSFVAVSQDLETRKEFLIDLSKSVIDPPKFRLGYVNVFSKNSGNSVYYLSRLPERTTSMGLNTRNTRSDPLDPEDYKREHTWNDLFTSKIFLQIVNNNYMSYKSFLASKYDMCALSQNLALMRVSLKTFGVFWDQTKCGEITGNTLELYPPFFWLKETLERHFKSKGDEINVSAAI